MRSQPGPITGISNVAAASASVMRVAQSSAIRIASVSMNTLRAPKLRASVCASQRADAELSARR